MGISPWKSRDAIPVKRAFYSFCLRRDVAGGDCDPNSGQKKEHLTFIGWVSALGLIPMDKIAQRSQANGVLGLCIAQCDLLGVSTAGKKLTRHRSAARSSLAPWLDPGRIVPSPSARSRRPTGRCGSAAMSAGAGL